MKMQLINITIPLSAAISTAGVLLVPYEAHHVEQYHEWMQNETLREATASDLLSLAEEYENQQSWRTASDKLTFIICQPLPPFPPPSSSSSSPSFTSSFSPSSAATPTPSSGDEMACEATVRAGEDDAPHRMVGDVNLFLTPCDDEEEEEEEKKGEKGTESDESGFPVSDVKGEIDIMIAAPGHRRKGLGGATVRAFLRYIAANQDAVLGEYVAGVRSDGGDGDGGVKTARLKRLVAKIHADNAGSIRLFGNLGFRRQGDPDYFNEVTMVMSDFPPASCALAMAEKGTEDRGVYSDVGYYKECFYDRSRLKE